jgi:glycosyltransferase involved in cell wall biosynthesis
MDAAIISLRFSSLSGILVRLICCVRGIPVLEWGHLVKHGKRSLRNNFRMFWYRRAQVLLPYGRFAKNYLLKLGFPKSRIFVVGNSLDYEVQIAVRRALTEKDQKACRESFGASSADDRLVFFCGRLEKRKRIDLLIKAVSLLKKRERRVFCVIIGDGLESEELKALSREMGLEDRITFLGACYDESRVGKVIFSCDLCVVPHAAGLSAVHSLVYGVPVLTSDVLQGDHGPEIETVVEGVTGSFFKDNDLDDLVKKTEAMLYPEPSRIQMSENCQNMIDKAYTPAHQERIFIKALNSCLPLNKQIEMPKRYP